jgi:hypothetical protein
MDEILNPTPEPTTDPAAEALERVAAAAGPGFDKSQMDLLKAKLAKLGKAPAAPAPTAEGEPGTAPPADAPEPPKVLLGKDVDWSEYDLDFNLIHLYKKAVFRETPQGPKWVTIITDFRSTTKDFRNYGKRVNAPGSSDKQETEPMNLGEFLNDMVNGKQEWRLEAVMPAGSQAGVLLSHQVPVYLPDPQQLKKAEDVPPPTDEELKRTEDAALAFVAEQGGVQSEQEALDTAVETGDNSPGTIGLRAIEKGTIEHEAALAQLDEKGALALRSTAVTDKALSLAAPEQVEAPQAGLETPEPVANESMGGALMPAAGYSAAQELLRALNDPNFRANLPKEE